ncbi:hypothetical protein G9A89_013101 [Geosiphon pyriformis]|nr:hypothetical protein G9A89_013101 [Geosiphon pyriformis]
MILEKKYDKSKPFLLDYEAVVGPSIAVIKQTVKSSGSEDGFKAVLSRKKRRGSVLEDNAGAEEGSTKVQSSCSWGSETSDTTESDSIDMEEECLVEETSFNYGESGALVGGDLDQTLKNLRLTTRKALRKPLEKINFLDDNNNDDVFLDAPLVLPSPLKNLVNVSVRKSFALDLDLKAVEGNLAQEKLKKIRSLFSGINGFGGASTSSKFSGIIRATFTSELGLMKATEKAIDRAVVMKKIPVGTLAEAVHAVLSEFGVIKAIKMQLIGLKDAVRVARADSDKEAWDDFVRSVGEKTCVIDRHSVMYAWARCAIVCFNSAESLDAAVKTMPVLRNTNLRWSCLISAKCTKCEKLGHTSLGCAVGGKLSSVARPVSFGGLSWAKIACECSSPPLSDQNVVVNNSSSLEIKPSLQVVMEVNDRFAALERSLTSLVEQVGKLAKRLDALGPMVPLDDQGADIVMSKGSGVSTSGGNVAGAVSFDVSSVSKLEDSMKCLMEMVLGLSAKVDSIVFTSGLDSGHLGAGVAVIMNVSLARHVCKVSEVSGRLLSIKLLFEGKLSVSILGLYAGASSVVRFSQAGEINSLIAKTVNESSFIILGGDFNEDGFHKSASFKRCFDLGLVNSLVGNPAAKILTWENSRGVKKTIDYVFVSSSLVNAIVRREVLNVSKHFDTDHQAVSVDLGLGGLLDTRLNSLRKQANKDHWKFDVNSASKAKWLEFRDASAANVSIFSDAFGVAVRFSDVDAMWDIVRKIMVLLANGTFKKKWFKGFDGVFTKISSRFHKLELLVSKLIKASHLASSNGFASLLKVWHRLDSPGASVVKSLFLSGSNSDFIHFALAKARKSYHFFKLVKSKCTEESSIKQAIGKRMESFELNKSHTIRSVLERPFCKVVLDHLVVEDELILEPVLVKSKMDEIMERWTKKREVVSDLSEDWARQY